MVAFCFAGFEGWDCSMLYIVMVALFFVTAIMRRQIVDLMDMEFSLIGGAIAAELTFIIVIIITHSLKWSFVIALIGALVGGVLLKFFGDIE
jgi:hypothetical protein